VRAEGGRTGVDAAGKKPDRAQLFWVRFPFF